MTIDSMEKLHRMTRFVVLLLLWAKIRWVVVENPFITSFRNLLRFFANFYIICFNSFIRSIIRFWILLFVLFFNDFRKSIFFFQSSNNLTVVWFERFSIKINCIILLIETLVNACLCSIISSYFFTFSSFDNKSISIVFTDNTKNWDNEIIVCTSRMLFLSFIFSDNLRDWLISLNVALYCENVAVEHDVVDDRNAFELKKMRSSFVLNYDSIELWKFLSQSIRLIIRLYLFL